MTGRVEGITLVLAATVAIGGLACSRSSTNPPQAKAEASGRPPVAVAVHSVEAADLTESVDVTGSLAPKFAADVKSEVSGTVKAVYVTQWVPVRKGEALARLDTSETEAGLEGLRALEAQSRVQETRAQREYERAIQLKQYGLITTQGLEDAKSALEAAQAASAAARAQVRTGEARLAKSAINAPMDGILAERFVSVGDRVENMGGNQPMFRIVDNRLLDLTVTIPSSELPGVRVGQPLEFTTDAVPGRTFSGKVMFINPMVDAASRSAKVTAEVPNADGALRGGLFVKGRIILSRRPGVIQVPREAMLNWNVSQNTATIFVVRNGQADERRVQTGAANGAAVEIVSGLHAGETVATRGAFALKNGDRVTVAREGA
jgi:membrane fusion protein (multidrug efflux system)